MKLSIAMATYNGERYLQDQLSSFAAQSRPPDQLVVCDDQSTDRTLDIVRDFGKNAGFEVIAIPNESRLGFIRNFSKAIDHCRGDIIFLSDQDDVWVADKLRRHEDVYLADTAGKIGLVFNNAEIVDLDLNPLGRSSFEEYGITDEVIEKLGSDRALSTLLDEPRISGCTLSLRSSLWNLLPDANSMIYHDHRLALSAAMLSRIRPLREKLNLYRQHSTQAIGVAGAAERPSANPTGKKIIRQSWTEAKAIQATAILDLIENLNDRGVQFAYQEYRHYMIGHLSHEWRRVAFPRSLIRRLPLVLIELILGNYSRYHADLKSVLSLDIRQKYFEGQYR